VNNLPTLLTLIVFAATLWRPSWALTAVIVMFPLEMLLSTSSSVLSSTQWLFNLATGLVVLVALVRRFIGGESLFQDLVTGTLLAGWGFYAWGYLSTAWTPTEGTFLYQTTSALPYWILIVVLSPMLLGRVEEVGPLCSSLLLVGTAVTLLILVNPSFTISASRLGTEQGADRGNPLALGTLGGTMMVVAALAPTAGIAAWRLFLNAGAFVAGAGLAVLSGSRGQVLFAIAVIAAMLPIRFRIATAKGFVLMTLGAAVVAGGMFLVFSQFVDRRNEERWDAESLTTGGTGRFVNIAELLGEWASSPGHWVQGLGLSAFASLDTTTGVKYSHVLFADAIGEAGLVGATLLGIMLVTGFRSARRLIAETDGDPRSRSFAITLSALALYHLLLANKQGGMLGNPMLFAFSIMLARVSLEWHHRWSEQQHFVEFNEFGESVDGSLEHFEPMEAGATR
jgi:hypothetical protein